MLSESRIKEAKANVSSYLQDGMLKKNVGQNQEILKVFVNNSYESIRTAELVYSHKYSNLWVIVTSYYSMYYIANAVLYNLGYKVGDRISHKVTSDSLVVYVRNRLKNSLIEEYEKLREEVLAGIRADEIIEIFDFERAKRGMFQYNTDEQAKLTKAQTSLRRAKEFLYEMNNLLKKNSQHNK